MEQIIVIERPPLFAEIAKVFDVVDKPIIFSWGDRIYNPMGVFITKALRAHEAVHGDQQTAEEANILAWWERYLVDPQFRLDQELPAHKAEYVALVKRHNNKRAIFLRQMAEKLSAPLYNNIVTFDQAKELLTK